MSAVAAQEVDRVELAIRAMRELGLDAFELVRAEELLIAYAARWADQEYTTLAVEQEFVAPLVNPDTGAPSRTFKIAGKLDAVARRPDGSTWVVEHKTSSEDISPGSEYWQRLRMDGQVSQYFDGAEALGYQPAGVLYDVILRPAQRPLKATPVESRKYKAGGILYANQRDRDETPEEFRLRVREALIEEPGRFFARGEVMRLETERIEHQRDAWLLAGNIRDARRLDVAVRNPDACQRFGKSCAFLSICTGEASADSFPRRTAEHAELTAGGQLITASRLKTWRRCPREHRYRYDMQLEPQRLDDAMHFGTVFHAGLEAWWSAAR